MKLASKNYKFLLFLILTGDPENQNKPRSKTMLVSGCSREITMLILKLKAREVKYSFFTYLRVTYKRLGNGPLLPETYVLYVSALTKFIYFFSK